MGLAVVGKQSLDEMEKTVVELFSGKIKNYSNHLNTKLVQFSNGQKLSSLQMVRYSNSI